MAFKNLIVVLACLALSHAAPQTTESPFASFEKKVEEFHKDFSDKLQKIANNENTQKLRDALKEGSDNVLKQISSFSATLQKAVTDADGKAKETLTKAQAEIQKTIEQLQKEHPEVQQEATKVRDQIVTAVGNVNKVTQDLTKKITENVDFNKDVAPKLKEAYDKFVEGAVTVQKKIHEAAEAKH